MSRRPSLDAEDVVALVLILSGVVLITYLLATEDYRLDNLPCRRSSSIMEEPSEHSTEE